MSLTARVDAIDALLPQTQCTRCGYADCRSYATAIVEDGQAINRCPPGGEKGMLRLAQLTGREPAPLDAACGQEGPLRLAMIDEAWCIGCTLCIKACPVDCIVGANKLMHTVIADQCTGCELCVPACPVDCISLVDVTPGKTGWAAWSAEQASLALQRYRERTARREQTLQDQAVRSIQKAELKRQDLAAHTHGGNEDEMARKRRVIDAALARARAKRSDA